MFAFKSKAIKTYFQIYFERISFWRLFSLPLSCFTQMKINFTEFCLQANKKKSHEILLASYSIEVACDEDEEIKKKTLER